MSNVTALDTNNLQWDHPNVMYAIIVSLGAGLSTGLGGALVFFPEFFNRVPQSTVLAVSLALSAGVMIYVSFIEIFAKSYAEIAGVEGISEGGASAITTTFFFLGMLVCVGLEVLVNYMSKHGGPQHEDICPAHAHESAATRASAGAGAAAAQDASSAEDEHEHNHADQAPDVQIDIVQSATTRNSATAGKGSGDGTDVSLAGDTSSLSRMGVMTALAIAIHNFPEGLATFLATVSDTKLGASLGVAIAVHNVPEGLCVAMPIYYATGSKWKGFLWSVLSGVTEPIGGILGFAVLQPVFTPLVFGIIFSMVGGMMVFIACHELLPAAHRYMGNSAKTTMWLILGMLIMAISLVLFVL